MNRLIHTPEGVRDYYNLECAKKMEIGARLDRIIKSYGYRFIQTPTFEYFDIFNKERGSAVSREMYKFFDHNNDTLVLRPDITPSIARAVSKYYMEEDMPIRLCYHGNTFFNNVSYQGRLREMTHVGCELFGDETSDADAEIISIVIDCLKSSGLSEFQVEIGNIDFFNGLMEEANLDEEEINDLRSLIENKNYPAIDAMLSRKEINENLKQVIIRLPEMFGSIERLSQAAEMTTNEKALQALERLEKIYRILQSYSLERYVTFDLGMLGSFKYYTGMIFQAYTYGTGERIVTGGRYDRLVKQYGKDCAAVGFAIKLDMLMLALQRQGIPVETDIGCVMVLYERAQKERAVHLAQRLRLEGQNVQMMKKYYEKTLADYEAYAARNYCSRIYFIDEQGAACEIPVAPDSDKAE